MRALSLHQPWATAVVRGAKRMETRSWRVAGVLPASGMWVAIHATKVRQFVDGGIPEWAAASLRRSGHTDGQTLPTGAVVGVVRLLGCVRAEEARPSAEEALWGDFAPGRWAWILSGDVELNRPVPCRGMIGFWELSEEIEAAVAPATFCK